MVFGSKMIISAHMPSCKMPLFLKPSLDVERSAAGSYPPGKWTACLSKVFNGFGDSAICVGVGLYILSQVLMQRESESPEAQQS